MKGLARGSFEQIRGYWHKLASACIKSPLDLIYWASFLRLSSRQFHVVGLSCVSRTREPLHNAPQEKPLKGRWWSQGTDMPSLESSLSLQGYFFFFSNCWDIWACYSVYHMMYFLCFIDRHSQVKWRSLTKMLLCGIHGICNCTRVMYSMCGFTFTPRFWSCLVK